MQLLLLLIRIFKVEKLKTGFIAKWTTLLAVTFQHMKTHGKVSYHFEALELLDLISQEREIGATCGLFC